MIKRITLENFFSFQSETIELDAHANVLVGINGSGKSNILKALKLLQRAANGGMQELLINQWGGFDAIYFKGKTEKPYIRLEFVLDKDKIAEPGRYPKDVHYEIVINRASIETSYYLDERLFQGIGKDDYWPFMQFKNGEGRISISSNDERSHKDLDARETVLSKLSGLDAASFITDFKIALKDIAVYDYFDTRPDSKMRRPMYPISDKQLSTDGNNLTQILSTIKTTDRNNFKNIIRQLNNINEKFQDIDFNLIGSNIYLLLLEQGFNNSVTVTHVSDGTLRFLCLLAIFYNANRGKLVCIDEPELGLHPDMIHILNSCIRETSDNTQYIIATHSETVLDGFILEKIRVLEKNKNNATIIKSFTEEDFKDWYDNFEVGQMWRMGDIGGNRW